ncbi:MAG: pilus assembly PilX N-terminal domain-containing protein [Acidobacteria bacterium]|nr:pilus assembly PilX N-terminal domain-containing protein [Acidobacteriota bacterium]
MGTTLTDQLKDDGRRGERGAALIMTLLVATLLLSAGGALIFTAAMSGINASDSTTEMQAYYGAEAGLQTAINVVRGNVNSNPAGTKASFRNIADNPTLSKWVTYNGTAKDGTFVVKVNEAGSSFTAYNIRIIDPDVTPAAKEPSRLLIQVRGYGPRGAIKNKEMIINRFLYDPDVPAAITLVGAETGTSMVVGDFDIGDSSVKGYTGTDSAGSTVLKATFGFTQDADKTLADDFFTSSSKASDTTENTPRTKKFTSAELPGWLRTADKTRTFLSDVETIATDEERIFTVSPAKDNFGTSANPKLTFVKGDCEFSGEGVGMLIVTGTLTLKGDFSYDGVILVLGTGSIVRNGGGGGDVLGGLIMASLNRADTGGKFLAKPTFNTNGGGNSDIKYNSLNVENAFRTLGPSVKGVREF